MGEIIMKANGNEITWKTDINADILDSSKYILTEFKSVPGQLCDKIINRLRQRFQVMKGIIKLLKALFSRWI